MPEPAERMQCMEIWGGNRALSKSFQAPGLDIHVHSAPYKDSATGGGDLYYLTSCASGRISRFLLADVSGHGAAVSKLALSIRDLLRKNVNRINQEKFVTEMNLEFGGVANESGFATAIVATFFEPKQTLSISIAGHPYPLYYRAAEKRWVHLDPADACTKGPRNLPLGVHTESKYPVQKIKTAAGDMFLLYSDAFIESTTSDGQQVQIQGVLKILNSIEQPRPETIITQLREQISAMSQGNLLDDDATLILGHFTETKVRLRDSLLAPFRLLGSVRNNTSWPT
jgi:phosphoserine phosphatase RsbU/P